jgi:hypothetical protein
MVSQQSTFRITDDDEFYASQSQTHKRRRSPSYESVEGGSKDRNTRRRQNSTSPQRERGRGRIRSQSQKVRNRLRDGSRTPPSRSSRSLTPRDVSMAKGRESAERHLSPRSSERRNQRRRSRSRSHSPYRQSKQESYRRRAGGGKPDGSVRKPNVGQVPRQRSPSPFSKRLALTQALRPGR